MPSVLKMKRACKATMLPFLYVMMLPKALGESVIPDWMETSAFMTRDGEIFNPDTSFRNADGSSLVSLVDDSKRSEEDPKYDFSCAIENKEEIHEKFPGWNMRVNTHEKQAIPYSWQPILEPIAGCNGLADGKVLKPNYVFVLDETWIRMYNKYSKFFKIQGYDTLEKSPYIIIDRTNYILGKQFGVQIIASKVVALPNLKNACDKRKGNAEDGTDETNTKLALKNAGEALPKNSAGFVRLGSDTEHSCRTQGGFTANPCRFQASAKINSKIFDEFGRLFAGGAASGLAHELMHSYGICPPGRSECESGHTRNDIPDIMVWNGGPSGENGVGVSRKFLTTCAPYIYGDFVCGNVIKTKLEKCSVAGPLTEPFPTNIAMGKFPWQSSTCSEGDASIAIDGETNGPAARTCNEVNNWWKLTFRPNTLVKEVVVWGPELDNAEVQIYNEGKPVASRILSNKERINGNYSFKLENEVRADFIKISIENKSLHLREVQVFGFEPAGDQNVAVGKSATQSSTCSGGVASRAVDGDTNSRWNHGSTTHTCNDPVNWWKVKLPPNTLVNEVRFVARYTQSGDIASGVAEIYDGDELVAATDGLTRGLQHYEYMFGLKQQVKADSIKLSLAHKPVMLGEVEVFGYEPTFWNIAENKTPTKLKNTSWEVKLKPGSQVYEVVVPNPERKHAVITIYKDGNEVTSKEFTEEFTNYQRKHHHKLRYSLSLENKVDADTIKISSNDDLSLTEVEVYGTDIPSWISWEGLTFPNIAKGRPAKQSSTCSGGEASRAVDGNTDGTWGKGSVTHTCNKGDNWWQVKLKPGSVVYQVVVWDRTDCCAKIQGSTLQIIKDGEVVESKKFHNKSTPSGTFVLEKGTEADYVKVISRNVINLAEVEVFGTEGDNPDESPPAAPTKESSTYPNIALGKSVHQSSTSHGGVAKRAVDGNTDGNWSKGSVTHTRRPGWWEVKLHPGSVVYEVIVWNRTGCCERLKGSTIEIIKDGEVVESKVLNDVTLNVPSYSFKLEGGVEADTVKIVNTKKQLTLAEVQVFGTEGLLQ